MQQQIQINNGSMFSKHYADHDHLPHTQLSFSTTEYKDEVISYIAGCILRKVKNFCIALNALML